MTRLAEVSIAHQRRGEQADRIADTMAAIGNTAQAGYWRENAKMHYRAAARAAAPDEPCALPGYRYPLDPPPRSSGLARRLSALFIAGLVFGALALIAVAALS